MNITIYQTFDPKSAMFHKHINHVLNRIKTGASKELIERIRITGNKELKLKLPAILFSGEFSYRNAKSLLNYSGFICLDFDKFPDSDTLLSWKDTLEGDPYTYCVFLSPSGYGLKCIVKVPVRPENHKKYFDALKDYYGCEYFDAGCSDICRICFESYDPYLTINENSNTWDKEKVYIPSINTYHNSDLDEEKTANNLLKWWNRRFGLYDGQRNANLFKLCAAFNDYGITKEYALSLVSEFQQEDFKLTEIKQILKNAYNKVDKFGTLKF